MVGRRIPISESIHRHFKEAPEWCALSDIDLNIVEKSATCKEYDTGDLLFDENAPCLGVYFVTAGLLGVRKTAPDGESTLLRLAYPDDTLGYRPMLANQNHRAAAEVLKPSTVCLIQKAVVLPMIEDNPALGLNFLQRATTELGMAEERFHNTVTLSLRARFAHLLMIMKDRCGSVESEDGSLLLDLPISRGDLAAMLGVRRESVSRMIQKLEKEGITYMKNRHVEVKCPEKLMQELHPD